ncbi:MAG TPA: hypothetical protein VLG47_01015 [Candidatus Saccharimonadales bacterium]|nr:hypothetical protein [Candidatus Saccharimonadales bacterium]
MTEEVPFANRVPMYELPPDVLAADRAASLAFVGQRTGEMPNIHAVPHAPDAMGNAGSGQIDDYSYLDMSPYPPPPTYQHIESFTTHDETMYPVWLRPDPRGGSSTPGAVQDRRTHAEHPADTDSWESWYRPRKPGSPAPSRNTANSQDGDTLVQSAVQTGDETAAIPAYQEEFDGVGASAVDDVGSLDAYRNRVRQYAKTYGVPMDEAQILKEAQRQLKRDKKPGMLQRAKNRWFQLEGGKDDHRIVHERDEPYWIDAYVKAVGDTALWGAGYPGAVNSAKNKQELPAMTPDEVYDYDEGTGPHRGTDEMKQQMQERYTEWREGVRAQERRMRIANFLIGAYLTLPEPLQNAVNRAVDKRTAAKSKAKVAAA